MDAFLEKRDPPSVAANGRLRDAARVLGTALLLAALIGCGGETDDADGILTSGSKLYSQFDEELVIRHFFRDRRGGFFLDVGAGPPKKNSTTYYLEKHLGWSGIGIDALPEFAAAYERERPNTRFFQYIVTDHSGTHEPFYRVHGRKGTGLSSVFKDRHGHRNLPQDEIEVATITLDELLEQSGVSRIDFLSMDIEGSAPAALAGFDIGHYRPALVCIEAGKEPAYRQKLLDWFARYGYERIDAYLPHDAVNWYFRPVE